MGSDDGPEAWHVGDRAEGKGSESAYNPLSKQKPSTFSACRQIPLSLSVLRPVSDSTFSPSTSSRSSLSSSSSTTSATHLHATFLILLPTEGSDEESLGQMELGLESLALEEA